MNNPIIQFRQLRIVPAVGGAYQVAGDALELIQVLAAAFGAFFQMGVGIFVAAIQATVAVMVY